MSIYRELDYIRQTHENVEMEKNDALNKLVEIKNYVEKRNISTDDIGEDLLKLINGYDRVCAICSKPMTQGYFIDDGLEYYCSDDCLHEVYNDKDYQVMYDDEIAYWTEWED